MNFHKYKLDFATLKLGNHNSLAQLVKPLEFDLENSEENRKYLDILEYKKQVKLMKANVESDLTKLILN